MGGIYYRDNVAVEHVIAGTLVGFTHYDGTTTSDITGTPLTGTTLNQVRFTVFPFSNTTRVISVNDVDPPQSYLGSGTFAALGGSPPIAKCITTTFQRVILGNVTVSAVRRGSSLWVSNFQDPTTWQSVNQVDLPDTGDVIVEVKALNNQAFAIYKERSQWIGIGAGNVFPFIFSLQSQQPGPVSPAAVVQVEEAHYYLGLCGSIYRFDGTRSVRMGERIRALVSGNFDLTNINMTHGSYDATHKEIWWFWPSKQNISGFNGICYRLPYDDIPDAFSPLQTFSVFGTASFSWRSLTGTTWTNLSIYPSWFTPNFLTMYPTWSSFIQVGQWGLVMGGASGQIYSFGQQGGDAGSSIEAYWETPFRALAGVGENVRLDVIESNFRMEPVSTNAEIIAITSDTLADNGTSQPAQLVDIGSPVTTKLRAIYYNLQSRYLAVRHRIANAVSSIEYRGGTIFAYKREEQ